MLIAWTVKMYKSVKIHGKTVDTEKYIKLVKINTKY